MWAFFFFFASLQATRLSATRTLLHYNTESPSGAEAPHEQYVHTDQPTVRTLASPQSGYRLHERSTSVLEGSVVPTYPSLSPMAYPTFPTTPSSPTSSTFSSASTDASFASSFTSNSSSVLASTPTSSTSTPPAPFFSTIPSSELTSVISEILLLAASSSMNTTGISANSIFNPGTTLSRTYFNTTTITTAASVSGTAPSQSGSAGLFRSTVTSTSISTAADTSTTPATSSTSTTSAAATATAPAQKGASIQSTSHLSHAQLAGAVTGSVLAVGLALVTFFYLLLRRWKNATRRRREREVEMERDILFGAGRSLGYPNMGLDSGYGDENGGEGGGEGGGRGGGGGDEDGNRSATLPEEEHNSFDSWVSHPGYVAATSTAAPVATTGSRNEDAAVGGAGDNGTVAWDCDDFPVSPLTPAALFSTLSSPQRAFWSEPALGARNMGSGEGGSPPRDAVAARDGLTVPVRSMTVLRSSSVYSQSDSMERAAAVDAWERIGKGRAQHAWAEGIPRPRTGTVELEDTDRRATLPGLAI